MRIEFYYKETGDTCERDNFLIDCKGDIFDVPESRYRDDLCWEVVMTEHVTFNPFKRQLCYTEDSMIGTD